MKAVLSLPSRACLRPSPSLWKPHQAVRRVSTQATASDSPPPVVAVPEQLSLTISNPAFLLNHIAHRYSSTSRIIMEFVDNSLDDAEELYRSSSKGYPYPVRIEIDIDMKKRRLRISDNCRGMSASQLERLVKNVGESQKKGLSWLNGQFGFGVHAFRAAASVLKVRTRNGEGGNTVGIEVHRDHVSNILSPGVTESLPGDLTGTEVILDKFDRDWWKDVTMESLSEEIEHHFERLLSRDNLTIAIREVEDGLLVRERVCQPFDYDSVQGVRIEKVLNIKGLKGVVHEVPVKLVVAQNESTSHRARFFSLGRRIQEVALVPSFMKHSEYKKSLWGHPQVIGYVDVGTSLDPVITRDEFRRSSVRLNLFKELVRLEKDIKHALDVELGKQRVVSMGKLEETLENVIGKIAVEDRRTARRETREKNRLRKEALLKAKQEALEAKLAAAESEQEKLDALPQLSAEEALAQFQAQYGGTEGYKAYRDTLDRSNLPEIDPAEIEGVDDMEFEEIVRLDDDSTIPELNEVMEEMGEEEEVPADHEDATTNEVEELATKTAPSPPPKGAQQKSVRPETPSPTPNISGMHVNFVSMQSEDGEIPRTLTVDDTIHINTLHPDFIARMRSKLGRPLVTERLGAYLAIILSSHYHNQRYEKQGRDPTRGEIYEDLISTTSRVETALRRQMPSLQRSMSKVIPQSIVDTLEAPEEEMRPDLFEE